MSAFPSAPFPEYGSCGNNQSHPYLSQPPQSRYNHGHDHHQYQHHYHQQPTSNMASAPNVYPPYPPPYSPYPGQPMTGPMPGQPVGQYPQMAYPAQPGGGWYGQPQPQVVHVVTSEPARNVSAHATASNNFTSLPAIVIVSDTHHFLIYFYFLTPFMNPHERHSWTRLD